MNLTFWRKKTVIELLEQHLCLMTKDEKIAHLKAIIPQICPGVNISRNPPKGAKKAVKAGIVK
jgi:hypothetical protein